jgi:hypothetical protein
MRQIDLLFKSGSSCRFKFGLPILIFCGKMFDGRANKIIRKIVIYDNFILFTKCSPDG